MTIPLQSNEKRREDFQLALAVTELILGPTSVAYWQSTNSVFATAHDAAAGAYASGSIIQFQWWSPQASPPSGSYAMIRFRHKYSLLTVPPSATITSAVFTGMSIDVYISYPIELVAVDATGVQNSAYGYSDMRSRVVSLGSCMVNPSQTSYEIGLNSDGIALVQSKLGSILELGFRVRPDIDNIAPTFSGVESANMKTNTLHIIYI